MSAAVACKRSCCWTPHGVCARRGACQCHIAPDPEREARAAAIRAEALVQARTITDEHNPDGGNL